MFCSFLILFCDFSYNILYIALNIITFAHYKIYGYLYYLKGV